MKSLRLLFIVAGLVAAQVPSFESASIKLAGPDARDSGVDSDPGILRIQNQTLHGLLSIAYDVSASQVAGGPKWAESLRFDVAGKANGPAGSQALRAMLQTLLAERFKLAIHREPRTASGYALVVAKGGVKMAVSESKDSSSSGSRGRIEAKGLPLSRLAERLTRVMREPVQDATGLSGGYDFTLQWTPDELAGDPSANKDGAAPTIYTALQEQLGLRLESRKVSMEVIVIDGAEKPAEN